jgi:hypothetical protein
LYGPGDIDVVVKSMVIDASENVLIGGQSKFIQTEGEGFVMLVDIYGVAAFANTYASGATGGDEVHKVALQGDGSTFTAVGTSISIGEGAHNTHFLLTFDNTGSPGIVKNFQLATDTGIIAASANIAEMYMQGTNAHVIYDTAVAEIVD